MMREIFALFALNLRNKELYVSKVTPYHRVLENRMLSVFKENQRKLNIRRNLTASRIWEKYALVYFPSGQEKESKPV